MNCPKCAAEVPSANLTAELAHCDACGHVWELGDTVELPSAPSGVQMGRASRDRVEIQLWWRKDGRFHHLLWLFILLPPLLAPGFQAVVMAGVALVVWTAYHWNATQVVVTPQGLDVTHTFPTPFAPAVSLGADELAGIQVREQQEVQGRWNQRLESFYTLSTPSAPILERWSNEAPLAHIRDAVAYVHGPGVLRRTEAIPVELPPAGVQVAPLDNGGVTLTMPWSAHAGVGIHVLAVFGLMTFSTHLVGMVMSGVFFAVWAYFYRNVTRVTITRDGLHIENGPLQTPWEPEVRLSAADVAQLNVREKEWQGFRSHLVYYNLLSGHRRLLAGWRDPGKLEYIVRCAQQVALEPEAASSEPVQARRSVADRVNAARR